MSSISAKEERAGALEAIRKEETDEKVASKGKSSLRKDYFLKCSGKSVKGDLNWRRISTGLQSHQHGILSAKTSFYMFVRFFHQQQMCPINPSISGK